MLQVDDINSLGQHPLVELQAQSAFVQRQLKAANTQSKELFELSTQAAQQTFENVNAMLARSLEPLKKVG